MSPALPSALLRQGFACLILLYQSPGQWGADLLGWVQATANPNHCLQELGCFQLEIQPQPAPLIIPCPLESCLKNFPGPRWPRPQHHAWL